MRTYRAQQFSNQPPGLLALHIAAERRTFDPALRTGTRDRRCGLYGGPGSMLNFEDMLALDVSPLAIRDLDAGRCEIDWPK